MPFRAATAAFGLAALVALAGCGAGPSAVAARTETPAEAKAGVETAGTLTAVRVVDGDTIEASDGITYRLAAIDAPESGDDLGPAATRRLEELLAGHITVELAEVAPIDRYGRTLAYVFVGEIFVNEALIREGLAEEKFYGDNAKYRQRYLEAQASAQANGLGIWATPATTTAPPTTSIVPPPTTLPPPPPPTTAPPPVVTVPPSPQPVQNCTPGYDPCVPPASDVDCLGGSGNGPAYTGPVRVTGPDIYDLDGDGDGLGCE